MSHPYRLVVLAAACLSLAAAAPAYAADVAVRQEGDASNLVFAAVPGEANQVTVTSLAPGTLQIADSGAPLRAGAGCRRLDANTAECSRTPVLNRPYFDSVLVDLGDGDDAVSADGHLQLVANGGPGDDVLRGGDGGDVLDGGGGTDRMLGGPGYDTLRDGDVTGAADADVYDGGSGGATADYSRRTGDLTLDLRDGHSGQGEPGEGDVVRNVGSATGGSGDDVIHASRHPKGLQDGLSLLDGGAGDDHLDGHAGPDRMHGGDGADRLRGGDGDDTIDGDAGDDRLHGDRDDDLLAGGPGADRLDGGAGNDETSPSRADGLACGAGTDQLDNPGLRVRVWSGCERLVYLFDPDTGRIVHDAADARIVIDPHLHRATSRSVRLLAACPTFEASDDSCSAVTQHVRLLAAGDGRTLGAGTLHRGRSRSLRPITVELTSTGRRRAARRSGVPARVWFTTGSHTEFVWTVVLRVRWSRPGA